MVMRDHIYKEQYGVQMLRAVAATAVVCHHMLDVSNNSPTAFSPNWLTTSGASGVDVFFVISGFIMFYTSFRSDRPTITPLAFLVRRATRIYPLYWICCLATLLIMALGFLKNRSIDVSSIVLSILLIPTRIQLIGVSWTLVFEVYFYIVFSATLKFRSGMVTAALTAAIISFFGVVGIFLPGSALRSFITNPVAYEFILGILLAAVFIKTDNSVWLKTFPLGWAVIGFIILLIAPIFIVPPTNFGLLGWSRFFAWGLPALLIVAASLSISAPRNLTQRYMVFLGDASYSIYLTHTFVIMLYYLILKNKHVAEAPQILLVPLMVIISIALGVATHICVEKPLLKFVKRQSKATVTAR